MPNESVLAAQGEVAGTAPARPVVYDPLRLGD
jgi:hypothetical protein